MFVRIEWCVRIETRADIAISRALESKPVGRYRRIPCLKATKKETKAGRPYERPAIAQGHRATPRRADSVR